MLVKNCTRNGGCNFFVLVGQLYAILQLFMLQYTKNVKGAIHGKEKHYEKGINCNINYSYNYHISNHRNRKLFC